MKQRFLTLVAMTALCVSSALAQTWTAPVEPEQPNVKGVELEDGASYYIRNVGAGQYMVGANSWATQISLSDNATPNLKVKLTSVTNSWVNAEDDPNYPATGWEMSLDGNHYFTGDHNRVDYEVAGGKKLFRDSETSGFVDLGSQNRGFIWTITKNDNGTYFIQTINGDPNYPNALTEYAGVEAGAEPGVPVVMNLGLDTEANWIEWEFIPTNLFTDYDAKVLLYQARLTLYNMLTDAAKYGADYAEASAVYNNAAATAEELQAAAEALKPAVRTALIAYAQKNSTPASPIDLTNYVLVNPSFDTGDITGWNVTAGIGQNQGYQNNSTYKNEEKDIFISQFIEAWRPAPNTLNDGKIYQTIKGLPSGRYILECDGIARNQTAEGNDGYVDPEDYRGIYLFYTDGKIVVHDDATLRDIETQDGDGNYIRVPEHFTFEFDIEQTDSINIGLMSENTNLNWMAADNFKLYAAGPSQTPPVFVALRSEISTSQSIAAQQDNDQHCLTSLLTELKAAIEEASPLVAGAADPSQINAYTAAYNKLKAAREALQASIAAYAQVPAFIQKLQTDSERYSSESYAALKTKVDALLTTMTDGYEQNALTTDAITEAIESYDAMVLATVKEIFENASANGKELADPIDITALFSDMTYAYGTSQVAFGGGYPAENPVWMNETGTGNFKTNYSTAEVWDARPFNVYRDFTGLPKGKYTIQTHAFYRVEANDANYPNYASGAYEGNEYAYIYAGNNKTPLINNAAIACPEFSELDAPYDCTDGNFLPNNQHSAYMIFTEERFAAQAEQTLVQASAVVTEDNGTLRVGITGTDMLAANHWTIWYGWSLLYHGVSSDALSEELQNLIATASETETWNVAEGEQKMNTAIDNAEKALDGNDDAKNAAITALKEAIAYAKASEALVNTVYMLPTDYQDKLAEVAEYTFTDTKFLAKLEEVEAANANYDYPSNAKLQEWIDQLQAMWPEYLLSNADMANATLDTPIDMSMIIVNPSFDDAVGDFTGIPNGWTAVIESNGGKGRETIMEFWNCSAFDFYQDLPKLKNGYWRLQADATFRAGGADNEVSGLTTKNDTVFFNEEYLYVSMKDFNKSQKVVQWSKGLVQNNDENAELVATLTGATDYNITIGEESVPFKGANNQAALANFFAAGLYNNVIDFYYDEANGPVRIGLQLRAAFSNCWAPFDNFRLSYLGNTAPDAVQSLEAEGQNAGPQAIFSLDGRQQNRLSRGINIVRMADGSVRKVMVK